MTTPILLLIGYYRLEILVLRLKLESGQSNDLLNNL